MAAPVEATGERQHAGLRKQENGETSTSSGPVGGLLLTSFKFGYQVCAALDRCTCDPYYDSVQVPQESLVHDPAEFPPNGCSSEINRHPEGKRRTGC